jgi:phenylacetic acid degradation operon negative regulatory protein
MLGMFARDQSRPVWSGGLVELLGEFGFSPAAARIALARVVDRGILERRKEGRLVFYVVAPRTQELIEVGDRRLTEFALEQPWDGTWSLVWYSIPDEMRRQRHRLSRRLRFLGFGPLEDSTWIAPRDQRDEVVGYLARLGVNDMAGMLVGQLATDLTPQAVIARAWDSSSATERYRGFVGEFSRYRTRKRIGDQEAFLACARLANTYRRFPYIDPGLPPALFPAARHRRAVIDLVRELTPVLVEPAQRYFDATARPK